MNDELRKEWRIFELEEFPAACTGRAAGDQTWEQVDAVAAACIATLLASGTLDGECRALLEDAILRLTEITALAEEEHRHYFSQLLGLASQAREALGKQA
jgi:hypothetical protein